MNEFDSGGQVDVIGAVISTQARGRERQHGAQALATRLHQMCRHFRDARRMLGCHAFTDQHIHAVHIGCQIGIQPVVRFLRGFVQTHLSSALSDKARI